MAARESVFARREELASTCADTFNTLSNVFRMFGVEAEKDFEVQTKVCCSPHRIDLS